MKLADVTDRMILKQDLLPLALYEAAIESFQAFTASQHWLQDALSMNTTAHYIPSKSFQALYSFIYDHIFRNRPVTKIMLQDAFHDYIDSIFLEIKPFLEEEEALSMKKSLPQASLSIDIIEIALENEHILSSLSSDYHLVRDIVTQKKAFIENRDGTYSSEIISTTGDLRGKAEIRPVEFNTIGLEHKELWMNLVESTINSFDELTADLLDLIAHMWLFQPKDEDGYIHFHSDAALRLRYQELETTSFYAREHERFTVMKRVAALSSLWISMRNNTVEIIDSEKINSDTAHENYDFTTFHRMFDINSVQVAYDKKTGQAKGIFALNIKPAPILRKYLDSSVQTFGLIDLKVFKYSHRKQREHKRLVRYLNYQWKIRTLEKTLQQPFTIKALVETIRPPASYNGTAIKERLELVLDHLQGDQVIKEWYYTEPLDLTRIGKKNWFVHYWCSLSVMIIPPDHVTQHNLQPILPSTIHEQPVVQPKRPQQIIAQEFQLHVPKPLTPQDITHIVEKRGLSIRGAAKEIGISHSTLLRYMNNELKRYNKASVEKLSIWYQKNQHV